MIETKRLQTWVLHLFASLVTWKSTVEQWKKTNTPKETSGLDFHLSIQLRCLSKHHVSAQLVLAVTVIFQGALPKKHIQFGHISLFDMFFGGSSPKIIKQTFSRHNHLGSSQSKLIGASQVASVHSNKPPASGMSAMLATEDVKVCACTCICICKRTCKICIWISICIWTCKCTCEFKWHAIVHGYAFSVGPVDQLKGWAGAVWCGYCTSSIHFFHIRCPVTRRKHMEKMQNIHILKTINQYLEELNFWWVTCKTPLNSKELRE